MSERRIYIVVVAAASVIVGIVAFAIAAGGKHPCGHSSNALTTGGLVVALALLLRRS